MFKKLALLFTLPLLYGSSIAKQGNKLRYEQILKISLSDSLLSISTYVKEQLYKFIPTQKQIAESSVGTHLLLTGANQKNNN